ncbi:FtsK/SpoIIIE domain-containing protein [Helicobacter suis]|uniref:FtsK/SpoIIIE domain-containing protein n=1 Tax=Helicobacter suis TaxID=104628 RepID=UPI001F082624|nr:FtsK/SpoIIIE domain-containing protein [Helicobacter suis]
MTAMQEALMRFDQAIQQVRYENSPVFRLEEFHKQVIAIRDQIRAIQPQLDSQFHINESKAYPEFFALGVLKVSDDPSFSPAFEPFYIPNTYPFPPPALYGDAEHTPQFLREALIRLVSAVPLTHLQVVLVDALELGGVFKLARRFLKKDHDFIYQQRILSESAEIKEALKSLCAYLKINLQEKLAGYKDFMDFNRHNQDILEVRALFFSGVDVLDSESKNYLAQIVRFGPANGVLSFIYNKSENEQLSQETLALNKILETYGRAFNASYKYQHLHIEVLPDSSSSQEHLNAFASDVVRYYEERKQVKREVSMLQQKEKFWSKNSTHIVSVPIGWDENHKEVLFEIGGDQTQHHTLVCGRSGSGKSNFLNVLIQNLAFYYSPDEVRLFLLDYKEGVEFNAYATPPLEHAQLVSVQSSVPFGIDFLKWLNGELANRGQIFKDNKVKDIKEYRLKLQENLPRLVVIIDEFQVLFSNSDKESNQVENLIRTLLKKGRSYGIHLVFSTQTLRGSSIPDDFKAQIGNRIALAMDSDDVQKILEISGAALYGDKARLPKGSPEGIYNNAGGSVAENVFMIIPYAANEKLPDFILKTNQCAKEKNTAQVPHKLYNGEEPIMMPDLLEVQGKTLQLGVGVGYEQEIFKLTLGQGRGEHLLIVGGLEAKIAWLKILGRNFEVLGKQVYHYQADKQIARRLKELQAFKIAPTHTSAQMFSENLSSDCFILIDSLDDATDLHSEREGQLKEWKAFLKTASDQEQHFIIFASNFKKLRSSHELKDVLESLQYRIVFQSNLDNLIGATSSEIRGQLNPLDARFFNTATDAYKDFRPYSLKY